MFRFSLLAAAVAAINSCALAQFCDPSWSSPYQAGRLDGSSGIVYDMIEFDFGVGPQLVAGGSFRSAGLGEGNNIARTTTSLGWESVGGGLNGTVLALEAFNDGGGLKLYAGGSFGTLDNEAGCGIRRWNGTAWESIAGPDGAVKDLQVFNDGTGSALYATGSFATVNGVPMPGIAKWNGVAWTGVGGGIIGGFGNTMCVWDGPQGLRLVLGGAFQRLGTTAVINVGQWDGRAWTAVPGFDDVAQVLSVGSYVKPGTRELWIGTSGPASNALRKWNGSNIQIVSLSGAGANQIQRMVQSVENGEQVLLVAGNFQAQSGSTARNLLKWNGVQWSNVITTNVSPFAPVYAVAYHRFSGDSVARLCAGGALSLVVPYGAGGSAMYTGPVATTRPDRTAFAALNASLTNPGVRALEFAPVAGRDVLYAGGYFGPAFVFNPGFQYIARWVDGNWRALPAAVAGGVEAFARFGNDLIVGGSFVSFTPAMGSATNVGYVARWDGAQFTTMPGAGLYGNGVSYPVRCMTSGVENSSPVVYAGLQSSFNGVARWDGSSWSTLNSLSNATVNAMVYGDLGDGPRLYAAGTFYGLSPTPAVAKAGTQGWESVAAGQRYGIGNAIKIVNLGAGPRLIAAGLIGIQPSDQSPSYAYYPVAILESGRWRPMGTNITGLVNAIEVFDDGGGPVLYATGDFTVDGQGAASGRNMARFNGLRWELVDGGLNGDGWVLRAPATADRGLLVGGNFSRAGALAAYGVAEIAACPPCPADFDRSGGVDGGDVEAFFTAWEASDRTADVNLDGGTDGADVEYFFRAWEAGGC
ncbi:MAG: hypothetical protein JSR77_03980 [Planctomycetes bacterium]|nr:hypothetical protein [Planctomycetota bacterium]